MFDTRNDYYLNFCFYFWKRKSCTNFNHLPIRQEKRKEIYRNFAIFTVTVPLVLPTGTKDSEKFTKFRNIHSNDSTSPSHRHEGLNNKNQTSPPESSGNKPGRASDLYYRTFFLRGKLTARHLVFTQI